MRGVVGQNTILIYLAALADMDGCERDPIAAHKINVVATQN